MAATKSYEFRMSKKVAELTQVVHMLFTRNHEKEVEMEALKELYEEEIDHILADATSRIQKAEHKLREHEREKSKVEEEMSSRTVEWEKRMLDVEEELASEKKECQNVRDLLIHAQNDIDRLKRGQSEELLEMTTELEAKCRELSQLKVHFHTLERASKEKDSRLIAISELHKTNERLQKDLCRTKEALDNCERVKDDLAAKNKQLESDVKQLRREMTRRLSEKSSAKSQAEVKVQPPAMFVVRGSSAQDTNDELDKMRREIQKYKMELYNRENNFNRMFREKQPVFVDRKKSQRSVSLTEGASQPRQVRERTMPVEARTLQSTYRDQPSDAGSFSPSLSLTSEGLVSERLPQLNSDVKPLSRNNTSSRLLVKPKPLPRELLSAKAH